MKTITNLLNFFNLFVNKNKLNLNNYFMKKQNFTSEKEQQIFNKAKELFSTFEELKNKKEFYDAKRHLTLAKKELEKLNFRPDNEFILEINYELHKLKQYELIKRKEKREYLDKERY